MGPNEASGRKKQELVLSEEVRLLDGAEIPAQTEQRSKNGSLTINPLCHSVMTNLEPWSIKKTLKHRDLVSFKIINHLL